MLPFFVPIPLHIKYSGQLGGKCIHYLNRQGRNQEHICVIPVSHLGRSRSLSHSYIYKLSTKTRRLTVWPNFPAVFQVQRWCGGGDLGTDTYKSDFSSSTVPVHWLGSVQWAIWQPKHKIYFHTHTGPPWYNNTETLGIGWRINVICHNYIAQKTEPEQTTYHQAPSSLAKRAPAPPAIPLPPHLLS